MEIGNVSTDLIGKILERERRALAIRAKFRIPRNQNVPPYEARALGEHNAKAAALLNLMLDRMDHIIEDDTGATVYRVVCPPDMVLQLEAWGADVSEMESAHDDERIDYIELTG